jgi:hypothetical protein
MWRCSGVPWGPLRGQLLYGGSGGEGRKAAASILGSLRQGATACSMLG